MSVVQRLPPLLVVGLITRRLLIAVIQNTKPMTSRMTAFKSAVPLYVLPCHRHAALIPDVFGFQHQVAWAMISTYPISSAE